MSNKLFEQVQNRVNSLKAFDKAIGERMRSKRIDSENSPEEMLRQIKDKRAAQQDIEDLNYARDNYLKKESWSEITKVNRENHSEATRKISNILKASEQLKVDYQNSLKNLDNEFWTLIHDFATQRTELIDMGCTLGFDSMELEHYMVELRATSPAYIISEEPIHLI